MAECELSRSVSEYAGLACASEFAAQRSAVCRSRADVQIGVNLARPTTEGIPDLVDTRN